MNEIFIRLHDAQHLTSANEISDARLDDLSSLYPISFVDVIKTGIGRVKSKRYPTFLYFYCKYL